MKRRLEITKNPAGDSVERLQLSVTRDPERRATIYAVAAQAGAWVRNALAHAHGVTPLPRELLEDAIAVLTITASDIAEELDQAPETAGEVN